MSEDLTVWPLDTPLSALQLSVRTFNVLNNNMGLKTVRDVITLPDSHLLRQENFGRKSLNELKVRLKNANDQAYLKYADQIKTLSDEISYWKGRAEGMERMAEIIGQSLSALAKARGETT